MGWLSGLAWCFAGIGGIGLTCGVFLYVFQDRLLYIPQVPVRDPDDNPLGKYQRETREVVKRGSMLML